MRPPYCAGRADSIFHALPAVLCYLWGCSHCSNTLCAMPQASPEGHPDFCAQGQGQVVIRAALS